MLNAEFTSWVQHRFPGRVKLDEPLARYTSFGVGGPADALISIKNADQLKALVLACEAAGIPYTAVAGGTNLLVLDGGVRGVVINMNKGLKEITAETEADGRLTVLAQAGVNLSALCRYAMDKGLSGMNFALGIPGTVGGAIVMNAGTTRGVMADILEDVTFMLPDGQLVERRRDELTFAYRHLDLKAAVPSAAERVMITGARLAFRPGDPRRLREEAGAILKERLRHQPIGAQSAGCFFKNPEAGDAAGRLIDLAGLKGRAVGGAVVSDKHANYIINTGGASAADIMSLATLVRETVADKFGVWLEPEVKIIGE